MIPPKKEVAIATSGNETSKCRCFASTCVVSWTYGLFQAGDLSEAEAMREKLVHEGWRPDQALPRGWRWRPDSKVILKYPQLS